MLFLVGSSASALTTLAFLYVLSNFPSFIRQVKSGGAEPDVVVRLATFYQLNLVRVTFRFMYTVPLFTLALDGVRDGPHVVVRDPFWSDFLLMISGIGCVVSSAITLLIFFPRSLTRESGYEANDRPASCPKRPVPTVSAQASKPLVSPHYVPHTESTLATFRHHFASPEPTPDYESEYAASLGPAMASPIAMQGERSQDATWNVQIAMHEPSATFPYPDATYSYSRQPKGVVTSISQRSERSESPNSGLYRPPSQLHPYVTNFTSPIDLPQENNDDFADAI